MGNAAQQRRDLKQQRKARARELQEQRDRDTLESLGITVKEGRDQVTIAIRLGTDPVLGTIALGQMWRVLGQVESSLVVTLRLDGLSWADIGSLLGISGEATRQRFSDVDPLAS